MLYVIYILIEGSRASEWAQWMVDEHIQHLMDTGCFLRATLVRDAEADSQRRVGYRVYFRCATEADLARYEREHARQLRAEHATRYAGAVSVRRETLAIVSHCSSGT